MVKELDFQNVLPDVIRRKFFSNFVLVDQSRTLFRNNFEFEYTISPEIDNIVQQARVFARYSVSDGIFEGRFFNYATYNDDAITLMESAYIYSYCKAVFYGIQFALNLSSSNFMPSSNSYMFSGHKALFDAIVEGTFLDSTSLKSNIRVQLNVFEEIIERLELFDNYADWYDNVTNRLFDPQLEQVLNYLGTNPTAKDTFCLLPMNKYELNYGNLDTSPLGNLAFSGTMLELRYISCDEMISDKKSFLWNKANCIKITSETAIDVNDTIYENVLVENYDPTGIGDEIESITGFNPFKTVREIRQRGGGNGPNPPKGPRPTGKSPNGSNKPGDGKVKTADIKTGPITAAKNTIVEVSKQTKNLITNQGKRIITKENLQNIVSIIEIQFNTRLTRAEKKVLLGKTILQAVNQYTDSEKLSKFDPDETIYLLDGGKDKYETVTLTSVP